MIRNDKRTKTRIISLLMTMCMVLSLMPGTAFAETAATSSGSDVVYTSLTGSTTDTTKGDGTATNPYNRFETAVENVKDGGTIYIKASKGAFINGDEYGRLPYVIDKKIIVMPEPGASMAELSVRTAGIVLNADVTFQNIRLDFGNKTHDAIFANGHKLTLINVSRSDASREIDLFAGGLFFDRNEYYYKDENGEDVPWPDDIVKKVEGNTADKGIIEIRTDEKYADQTYGCSFGNIYAGSMNGPYAGSAEIIIDDSGSKIDKIEAVYARGAEEAVPGNMFDFSEPAPPSADDGYHVDGNVSIKLINQQVDTIDGFHGTKADQDDLGITSLAVSTKYRLGYVNISDIDEIIAENGTFAPQVDEDNNSFDALTIKEGAELDLSCRTDWTVGRFNGGGALTLAQEGSLHITDSLTGTTQLKTPGGTLVKTANGEEVESSGVVTADHVYVTSADPGENGEMAFTFVPFNAQSSYGLLFDNTPTPKWSVGVKVGTVILPKLESFVFVPTEQTISYGVINGTDIYASRDYASFDISAGIENAKEYVDVNDLEIQYAITDIPFSYSVVKDEKKIISNQKPSGEVGTYYVEIPELGMTLAVVYDPENGDELAKLMVYATPEDTEEMIEKGVIEPGIYEITLTADDKNGNPISKSVTLNVLKPEVGDEAAKNETSLTVGDMDNTSLGTVSMWNTGGLAIPVTVMSKKLEVGEIAISEDMTDMFHVYVNGIEVEAEYTVSNPVNNEVTATVAVTPENGFKINEASENDIDVNNITVVFDGNTSMTSTRASGTVMVSKANVTISGKDADTPIECTYDGKSHPYEGTPIIEGDSIPDAVKETIEEEITYLYKKDGSFDSKAPVHPGTYDVFAVVPEGELYEAVTETDAQQVGTITIEKATPEITLGGTVAADKTLTVKATMTGPEGCTVPWGNVYFSIQNKTAGSASTSGTAVLSYGEASHNFTSLSEGEYTVTALYVGDSETSDVSENSAYKTGISTTEDFTIAANHVSATDITISEKNVTLSVGGTNKQLTATFTPNEATDKAVSWESGDETIATVDGIGLVKPVAEGSTYVTVTSRDGGHKDSCFITVEKSTGTTPGGSGSGGGGDVSGGGGGGAAGGGGGAGSTEEPEVPEEPEEDQTEPEEPIVPDGSDDDSVSPDQPMGPSEPVIPEEEEAGPITEKKQVSEKENNVVIVADTNENGTAKIRSVKKTKRKTIKVASELTVKGYDYKVTVIGARAFKNCTKATKIILPGTVVKIEKYAFTGAKNVKIIKFTGKKAPIIAKGAFKGLNTKKMIIQVDKGMPKAQYDKLVKAARKAGFKGTFERVK